MGKIYYISDHHFFHLRIIEYCNRPFNHLEEMNVTMVDRWNDVVSSEDTVIYGGDLVLASVRGYKERVVLLLDILNGKKILVGGNHDRSHNTMIKLGFQSSSLYHFENDILVIHDLMRQWHMKEISELIEQAKYVLYGHVHGLLLDDPKVAGQEKFINISVEHLDYIPRNIEELKVIRRKQLKEGGV